MILFTTVHSRKCPETLLQEAPMARPATIAQSVERPPCKRQVGSSILPGGFVSMALFILRVAGSGSSHFDPPRGAEDGHGIDRDPFVHSLPAGAAPVHVVGIRLERVGPHRVVTFLGRPSPVGQS